MNSPTLDLSIVIPAYNEERRLPKTLDRIFAYLQARPYRAEVIVVDDGSSDRTAEIVNACRAKISRRCAWSRTEETGEKDSACATACWRRAGKSRFSPMRIFPRRSRKPTNCSQPCGTADIDAAIGSRAVDRSLIEVHQSVIREQAGIFFNRMVRWIMGIEFSDTQCGFKAFRRERARIIFEQQRVERFGFDPEILFLAKRNGLRVAEVPVRWSHDSATKVNVAADGIRMFLELLLIRWNAMRGRYPRACKS